MKARLMVHAAVAAAVVAAHLVGHVAYETLLDLAIHGLVYASHHGALALAGM